MHLILQIEFYLRFKVAHLEMSLGQQTFEGLKPSFVKPMCEHNTCCYIYHVEINEF
jgi:hypothetical protein